MAVITSPDSIVSATVIVGAQEGDGVYPIQITSVLPQGTAFAIELGGVRVYQETAQNGSGTEG